MTKSRPTLAPVPTNEARQAPKRFSNREAEENWTTQATTQTGLDLKIVPARAEDRDALERFFDRVTPQDLYFRFLSGLRKVDNNRITAMLRDDDDYSIDFLARDSDTDEILATAMIVADNAFYAAEFAMCTREDAKHKGISWVLLDHAAQYAAAMGIKRIYSIQSASQTDALKLEREMGFAVHTSSDDPATMMVEKNL